MVTVTETLRSIRSQTRTTSSSFGVRAWSFNEENCADLIAQSMTKHESDVYNVVTDLACSEDLCFSYCDDDGDESKYCSSQGTVFSEFHFEIFGECSQAELSDYSPSLFVDSESQFLEGSVGETPSPTHLLFLRYRKEFAALVSAPPVKNASNIEDAANVGFNFRINSKLLILLLVWLETMICLT